jgi:hypothetical protein
LTAQREQGDSLASKVDTAGRVRFLTAAVLLLQTVQLVEAEGQPEWFL